MTGLTHLDDDGAARMVDVGAKAPTARVAIARGLISMSDVALKAVREGSGPKGDAIATARIAGIMAGKRTSELIPLCHPLGLDALELEFAFIENGVTVTATTSLTGKTGVEMEALTAVSVALLTLYDMAKALDKAMTIGEIQLVEKRGGKSGTWRRDQTSN